MYFKDPISFLIDQVSMPAVVLLPISLLDIDKMDDLTGSRARSEEYHPLR